MEVRELLRGEGVGVGQEIGKGEGGYHPRRGSATKVQRKYKRKDTIPKNLHLHQSNGLVTRSAV
jgi:hypothetical protein